MAEHAPNRSVRVPNAIWNAAQAAAKAEGRTVSAIILAALVAFIRQHRESQS